MKILFLLYLIIVVAICFIFNHFYQKTSYYQITKNSYLSIRLDIGKYGEYLTYKKLKSLENQGCKFLFNIYIPKDDDNTTEIDVLLITTKGIFVFESKNYSGWIFGNEFQKNWTQTLPRGKKSHKETFFNPIMQNRVHIKYLKTLLGDTIPMHSIIVFSERCTLKNVNIKSPDIHVINRYNLYSTIERICAQTQEKLITEEDVLSIFNKLYPYTQVSQEVKEKHIESINRNHSENTPNPDKTVTNEICKPEILSYIEENIHIVDADSVTSTIHIETNKCPKCGGDLILRTAKRGQNIGKQFYGCSNYPKCRYMKEILQQEY